VVCGYVYVVPTLRAVVSLIADCRLSRQTEVVSRLAKERPNSQSRIPKKE
jgi:hypothetical protein